MRLPLSTPSEYSHTGSPASSYVYQYSSARSLLKISRLKPLPDSAGVYHEPLYDGSIACDGAGASSESRPSSAAAAARRMSWIRRMGSPVDVESPADCRAIRG